MSNQRPAWFRFSSIAVRPPVPARPPPQPSAPAPTQTPTLAPPPRPSPVATPAEPPPAAAANPPRSPAVSPPAAAANSPRSPAAMPPAIFAAPPRSPAAAATASSSPVVTPLTSQPSPPQKVSTPPPPKSPTLSYSPVLPKTTTRTNSQQSSPKKITQTPSPSSSPKQSPPTHKPVATLTLPPLQIKTDSGGKREPEPEIEEKIVLVHEPTHITPRSYVASKGKKSEPTYKIHNNPRTSKQVSDSEVFGMRVITLAGENRGAIMEIKPYSHNRKTKVGSLSGNGHQSCAENGEGTSKNSNKEKNDKTTVQPPMTAYLNSNVQGVNNSILYNTSCRHNDPGIHLSLTRKPNGGRK